MSGMITVGLDQAKTVLQVHGADASGRAVLRGTLRRAQVLGLFGRLGPCTVAMEACGGARHWGRGIGRLGHEVRLIPPAHGLPRTCSGVTPFARRQKSDAADAEAGLARRRSGPSMRLKAVRSEEARGRAASVFRVRELLIGRRTRTIDASCRGHALGAPRSPDGVRGGRPAGGLERPPPDRAGRGARERPAGDGAGDAAGSGRGSAPPRGAHRHAGRRDRAAGARGRDRAAGARGRDRAAGARGRDRAAGARGRDRAAGARGRSPASAR